MKERLGLPELHHLGPFDRDRLHGAGRAAVGELQRDLYQAVKSDADRNATRFFMYLRAGPKSAHRRQHLVRSLWADG
jgi:hypothetical protein